MYHRNPGFIAKIVAMFLCICAWTVMCFIGNSTTSIVSVFLMLDCGFLIISPALLPLRQQFRLQWWLVIFTYTWGLKSYRQNQNLLFNVKKNMILFTAVCCFIFLSSFIFLFWQESKCLTSHKQKKRKRVKKKTKSKLKFCAYI